MKVFITRQIPEAGIKLLQDKGYEVSVYQGDEMIPRAELLESVKGCDAILPLLTDKMDAEVFEAAGPQLKVVANYAVGFDNINLEDAKKHNVFTTNTPDVLTETVAEHAFGLILSIAQRITEGDRFTRAGKYHGWKPMLMLGNDVSHKTLGVLGLGRIGSRVAHHGAKGFDMNVIYYDVKRNEAFEKEYGAEFVADPEELLKRADFISVHVPLLPTTKHLINAERLKMMKPTAYLVNTSRGPVIDEAALVDALKNKVIRGAGLDVFENEPRLTPGLANLENIILTPHAASATEETRAKMSEVAALNIIDALEGGRPRNNLW
ncbi:MAG TPA: D-glycerate dehydrogenase [Candidatus Paceibacterota bacterium]